ncbi:MAG: eCIS core domain-containing protein [Bacteroidales bacterium]
MKSSPEKSTHTTATAEQQKSAQPFFAKAGGGDFFAPSQRSTIAVQPKLKVGQPDDKYEQEADSMADKVMQGPETAPAKSNSQQSVKGNGIIQKASLPEEKIQKQGKESNETDGNMGSEVGPATTTKIVNNMSAGEPLPKDVKNFMEPRFNADFSHVRIHTDKESSNLNNQLNAKAFTYKDHIFFSGEHYNPTSNAGKKLIAHELTHVVQQSPSGTLKRKKISEQDDKNNSLRLSAISNTGSAVIQRGLRDRIRSGFDALSSSVKNVVLGVRQAMGATIDTALGWITIIASRLGLGIENAWNFIKNIATRIAQNIINTWNWIQTVASQTALTITNAWNWIQALASQTAQNITSTWNWIQNVATKIGKKLPDSLAWIRVLASRIAQNITNAWNWIQALAARIAQNITNTWLWIQSVASKLGMLLQLAWAWIQFVASWIGLPIRLAWAWIQTVASSIGTIVVAAWNFIQRIGIFVFMPVQQAWLWIQLVASRIGVAVMPAWEFLLRIALRIGKLALPAWTFIQRVALMIFLPIKQAWLWVQFMANRVGMLILGAWKFIQTIALRIGAMVMPAWDFIQQVAILAMMTIRQAWLWVKMLAARVGAGITVAWKFLVRLALSIGMLVVAAWAWIQALSMMVMMAIQAAWAWINVVAKMLYLAIPMAWAWLKLMAVRLKKLVIVAWNWLFMAAIKLGRTILKTWSFLLNLAKKLGKTILEAWDWYWNAPTISIETDFFAAEGSVKNRTDIGVGEKLTFTGDKSGDWEINGGAPLTVAATKSFRWTAPNRAATLTAKLTSGKYSRTKALKIIEPSSTTAQRTREISYPRGIMGAGMSLQFKYYPGNVSFGNVEIREVSGSPSNISGYFIGEGAPYHDATGGSGIVKFHPIKSDNNLSVPDSAAIHDYPSPWRAGGFDWVIPNKFRVVSEGGDGKEFANVTQAFTVADSTGKTKITKAGAEVVRSP